MAIACVGSQLKAILTEVLSLVGFIAMLAMPSAVRGATIAAAGVGVI
jgi:hypothetical protein